MSDLSDLDFATPQHTLSCPIWQSSDPADTCTCGGDEPPTVRLPAIRHIDENGVAS